MLDTAVAAMSQDARSVARGGHDLDEITAPGVYDLSAARYHADPVSGGSLSSSGARKLLPPSCPALFAHWRAAGGEHRAVFDVGHAAHAVVLGAGAELAVVDASDWRGKAAREERDAAYAGGRTPLLRAEYDQVQAMSAALRAHPVAAALLDPARGRPEQTLIWRDEPTGVWRRAMLDWLPDAAPGRRLIVADYKTARSAEPGALSRALDSYGYAAQAAWYLDGVTALDLTGGGPAAFVFVAQEKDPPYVVTVFEPDAEALRWGALLNRKAIETYRRCTDAGHWPGYTDDVISVGLPAWAVRQHQAALDRGAYDLQEKTPT